jgi:hypothetical protein
MRKRYVGIDPGLSGAIALYDPETQKIKVEDMPVASHLINGKNKNRVVAPLLGDILRGWHLTHELFALVELVGGAGKQSAVASFTFGKTVGICTGVLSGVGIPFQEMRPQEWQKMVRVGKGKDAVRAMAAQMFPAQADLFKRKMDDGRADAALLAVVAYKTSQPTKIS